MIKQNKYNILYIYKINITINFAGLIKRIKDFDVN